MVCAWICGQYLKSYTEYHYQTPKYVKLQVTNVQNNTNTLLPTLICTEFKLEKR